MPAAALYRWKALPDPAVLPCPLDGYMEPGRPLERLLGNAADASKCVLRTPKRPGRVPLRPELCAGSAAARLPSGSPRMYMVCVRACVRARARACVCVRARVRVCACARACVCVRARARVCVHV